MVTYATFIAQSPGKAHSSAGMQTIVETAISQAKAEISEDAFGTTEVYDAAVTAAVMLKLAPVPTGKGATEAVYWEGQLNRYLRMAGGGVHTTE